MPAKVSRVRTQTAFYEPASWDKVRKTISKVERRRRKAALAKEALKLKKAQAKKKSKKAKKVKKTPTKAKRAVKKTTATKKTPTKAPRGAVKARTPVTKKTPKAKTTATASAVKKAKAAAGSLDATAAEKHPELAGGTLVLNAHLAQVEPSQNMDKFYVLQVVTVSGQSYCWQRWGRTGTSGQGKLDGPMDLAATKRIFEAKFKEKTGVSHQAAESGASALVNKYEWLSLNVAAGRKDTEGTWEYYMDNGVDGKADGWYPYTASGGAAVEELFKTYFVRGNETMGVRIVQSGSFSYKVDLTGHPEYTQSNTSTGKVRKIRRLGE